MGLNLTKMQRREIYDSTGGYCHLCRAKVYWTNYGKHGERGAWEIDHSVARANGGTDRMNNLRPAHTTCNRERQDLTARAYRERNDVKALPPSREQRRHDAAVNGALGFAMVLVILFAGVVWLVNKVSESTVPTVPA